ncbi:unnamed protein product [Lepidochelys olivacea]
MALLVNHISEAKAPEEPQDPSDCLEWGDKQVKELNGQQKSELSTEDMALAKPDWLIQNQAGWSTLRENTSEDSKKCDQIQNQSYLKEEEKESICLLQKESSLQIYI